MKAASFGACVLWAGMAGQAFAQAAAPAPAQPGGLSFVEFAGSSRLSASASAFNMPEAVGASSEPLRPGIRNETTRQATGAEQGACGVAARAGQSTVKSSAQLTAGLINFELELATALKVQGGIAAQGQEQQVPLGPKLCIPGPAIETSASAQAGSEASVEIRFRDNAAPGSYWLDVSFASKNTSGERDIELRGPEGQVLRPVSGEPVLLRAQPNTTWVLRAAFRDSATDAGKCCGKEQQATLQVTATVRPATGILEPKAAGNLPDDAGLFNVVGLLVTRSAKGEPQPVCVATAVGRNTVVTPARCLLRFGLDKPSPDRPLWFVQNANVQAGLRRGLNKVVGWSNRVSPLMVALAVTTEVKNSDRSEPSPRAKDDLAVVYLDGKLEAWATLHDGRTRLDKLLARNKSAGTLVSYGSPSRTGGQETSASSWVRSVADAQVANDTAAQELVVRTAEPQCGAEAGSPVFVSTGSARVLVGILTSGTRDCRYAAGPRMEGHIAWLRAEIDRKELP